MHRPNRIGDYLIADLSAANFTNVQSAANFAASVGTMTAHQVQTDTATLGDPISTVNFDTGDANKAFILGALESYAFGRFITGAALNDREMMIGYHCDIMVTTADLVDRMSLTLNAGIHNASSVTVDITTTVNLMDTRAIIGVGLTQGTRLIRLCASGQLVNSLFNGGASGIYDTNPLGIWWALNNTLSSGPITIQHWEGSLSIYRYSRDLDTFDPNR